MHCYLSTPDLHPRSACRRRSQARAKRDRQSALDIVRYNAIDAARSERERSCANAVNHADRCKQVKQLAFAAENAGAVRRAALCARAASATATTVRIVIRRAVRAVEARSCATRVGGERCGQATHTRSAPTPTGAIPSIRARLESVRQSPH